MNMVLTGIAVIGGLIVLAIILAGVIGVRQPSRRIHRNRAVIFAALRQEQPGTRLGTGDVLWRSSALFTLIGEGGPYCGPPYCFGPLE